MIEPVSVTIAVDFLPAHYHERTHKRRTDLWRLLVVGLLGSVIACTALVTHRMYRQAQTELVTVESLHGSSESTSKKIAELQAKLQPRRATAELLTYLRHPWPRSQILAAVVGPLPETVTLTRLHVVRELPAGAAGSQPPARTAASAAAASKDPQPASDLQRLRALGDGQPCIVVLAGTVTQPTDLYEYLARLGDQGLFSRVELGPVERAATNQQAARFTARLVVRPGYGEAGGPAPSAASAGATVAHAQR